MKQKKRVLLPLLLLLCFLLTGCSTSQTEEAGTRTIVCTTFAAYDWVMELTESADENLQVEYLLDNGVDVHNFQPTTEDFALINTCDVFIYSGGVSDTWVEDALEQTENKDMKIINFMDLEGIQLEAATDHDCEEEGHHHEHDHDFDEHVWLSIDNAEVCVQAIADMLAELEPQQAECFRSNCEDYLQQLEALDQKYKETMQQASTDTVLVADRFPFIYLMEEYGLEHHAAFPGCSAETEASFDTLVSLIEVLEDHQLTAVYVMEHSQPDVAETIIRESCMDSVEILTLNSMQSVAKTDIEKGATYLSLMEENRKALQAGLN